jgi:hypothetical protein
MQTNGTATLTINTSGQLLLGTTSTPSAGSAQAIFSNSVGAGLQLNSVTGSNGCLIQSASAQFTVNTYTGAIGSETYTERLRIGTSGEIGLSGANYGTSGQVLTSNGPGAAVSWTTLSGYAGPNYQAFTSPGTFTVPTGITRIKVTVIGAGGGGATYAPTVAGGGGGSGGLTINYITGLTPGGTAAVTVGTGGTVPGGPGGTSSFGPIVATTLTATGGTGASGASGGAGGAGTGYGVLVSGSGGGGGGKYVPGGAGGTFLTAGSTQNNTSAYSLYGQRGGGGSVAAPGPVATAGLVGGGGGGSGGPSSFPAGPGAAAGGNGLVLVEY